MSKRCGTKATGAKGVVYSLILRHTIDWTVVNPWAKLDTPPSGQRDLPPPVPSRQRILHGLVALGNLQYTSGCFFSVLVCFQQINRQHQQQKELNLLSPDVFSGVGKG